MAHSVNLLDILPKADLVLPPSASLGEEREGEGRGGEGRGGEGREWMKEKQQNMLMAFSSLTHSLNSKPELVGVLSRKGSREAVGLHHFDSLRVCICVIHTNGFSVKAPAPVSWPSNSKRPWALTQEITLLAISWQTRCLHSECISVRETPRAGGRCLFLQL